jgi:hypothetical protein
MFYNESMDVDLAAELYASGMTLRQVAAQLGYHYTAVHIAFVRAGIPRRSLGACNGSRRKPLVEVRCSWCHKPIMRKQQDVLHVTRDRWGRPKRRWYFCPRYCQGFAMRAYGPMWRLILPEQPAEVRARIDELRAESTHLGT